MKLNIRERIMIQNILPHEEDYVTYKIIRNLREQLSFTEEEIKEASLTTEVKDGRSIVLWDETKAFEKDIEIGEKASQIISEAFIKLNEAKKINDANYDLYEKFVVNK
jgi:hypothetical protein